TVLSDSEDSTVTYTTVSNPFGGLSNIGSSRVDGPPVMPEDPYAYVVAAFQAPPSPDYMPGPEYPPSLDFVPELVYLEFMPPEDEVLLAEEQPLPAAVSPTADSPGYVLESDPEQDLEEDDDEDPEEDPADYPVDGGDDGDDEDESSDDDDVDIEENKEEEEHPAPSDSTVVALSAIPSPPLPSILSPLPVSPPLLVSSPPPASPIRPLVYRAAMIWLRAEAPSTSHSLPLPPPIILFHTRSDAPSSETPPLLPIPAPTSSPPLLLPSTNCREDIPKVTLPSRKRLGIALGLRYEVGESSSAAAARPTRGSRVDYGFVATLDREIRHDPERYMEREARMSREAWGRSMDASDLARSKVMSLRTTVLGQQAVITELQAADRIRQAMITELLAADRIRQAQFIEALKLLKRLQTQMTEFERQQGPAKGPAQPDAPEESMIDQGVTATLAARVADRNTNSDDSHNLGTGVRRTERTAREFENQVKFVTCTLHSVTLTWWNTHVKTVGHDAAYSMPWKTLMKMITDKYCPRNEIKKLEMEIWGLKVKDKIEKYVGGLPDMIHGSVVASKPKTMQDAVEIATELMDKKIRTFVERRTESKTKFEDTSRNTQNHYHHQQQQQNKRQNTGRAYTAGTGEKKQSGGSKPLCSKCNYHHDGPCAPRCRKCNKGQKPTCYECRVQGHFKRECPKLKNNNHGNQVGGVNAPAKVSFVSTAFSSQIDITPTALDHYYDVELPDGRIIGLNTILRGCTLNILNHPFNIDLMPVELGSFDAIIGMDWLVKYQAIIVCAEKIVFFLENVTTKEIEDKSEKKRLEEVPIVRDIPEVFPKDLSGLPPTRQVEFQIDLILGAAPVA
ncbi:putative reverse transcriptase domain-containing protein, partial [Tanacetum coccineum]